MSRSKCREASQRYLKVLSNTQISKSKRGRVKGIKMVEFVYLELQFNDPFIEPKKELSRWPLRVSFDRQVLVLKLSIVDVHLWSEALWFYKNPNPSYRFDKFMQCFWILYRMAFVILSQASFGLAYFKLMRAYLLT